MPPRPGGFRFPLRNHPTALIATLLVLAQTHGVGLTLAALAVNLGLVVLAFAYSDTLARRIGDAAEQYRHTLAIEWIGSPLPRWSRPCPITAQVAPHLGAGGATTVSRVPGRFFFIWMAV